MNGEHHYGSRSGWLRAAVLGANDGILSTASIIIGVSAGSASKENIFLAGVAGLVAGAFSMAAGEYVSVSSQSDIETADIERERKELSDTPDAELKELANLYENRGLEKELSVEVAKQLMAHGALEAHARDELGINEITQAKPFKASLSSFAAFAFGGIMPVLVTLLAPLKDMEYAQYLTAIIFLMILGIVSARAGGSNVKIAVVRIAFWGTFAMGMTALIGYWFGTIIS
ncbi:VIT1/CCC1 family predicted Fe2+/Mn2+ transporter [Pedobacter sp. UYEF25]